MSFFRRPTLTAHANYQEKTKTDLVTPASGTQLVFVGATLNNRSGSAMTLGVAFKVSTTRWLAGQWTAAGNPEYTDDTTDAQDAGTNDFALFTTTNNDGFAVQCLDKFGIVGIDQTTASSGGSPVFAYAYWNGSSYATLTTVEVPTYTASAGERTIAFVPPIDWAVNSGQAVTDGLTAGYYSIRVIATTAPSSAGGSAATLWVGRLYDFKANVSDTAVLNAIPEDSDRGIVLQGGESIIPYFGTANANNSVSVRYSIRG